MTILKLTSAVAGTALLAIAASAGGSNTVQAAEGFAITSSAFKDNDILDRKFAAKGGPRKCDGENVSPPLQWSNAPAKTKSFAIVVHDSVGGHGLGIDHWVAYGIPASTTSFAEGAVNKPPQGGNYVGGKNRIGKPFYFGPCPDVGDVPHHYEFMVIATDLEPGALAAGLDKQGLIKATEGHRLGATSIIGRYARK
jgi:Raf kinase inhibitor-like YbhB/YbcL family protein